ncbi:metal ABC transporter permease [bacterium BMS3Abin03]|nr:metal ABC transporter permease [bacterium BMS3Abin03]MCG6958896.1 metal ABC transporter permease [bacterium BMS3Abin03]
MELSIWDIMAPAFFECLILVGIHSYLGLHVIRRKVIFVDLALAQIAALGTTVGFLFGIMPDTTGAYWFSLAFTFIGAGVFSISRIRHEKIPQEAVIGLAYAIAASVAILVIDKAPHGAEHIKEILTGSILWVKWDTIRNAAIVYSLIGIFHFIYRKRFILISEKPEKAYKEGINVRFWDFLFYVSFGVVITHSVGTAGVLLVFVFLVVPAITSMLITNVLWKQLIIGWIMGVVVSIAGLYLSYIGDLPSGPTVVSFYGLMLIMVALFLYIYRAEMRKKALTRVALGLGTIIIVAFGFYLLGYVFSNSHQDHTHLEMREEVSHNDLHSDSPDIGTMTDKELNDYLSSEEDINQLNGLFDQADEYNKFNIANRVLELNNKNGFGLLISILQTGELPFVKEEAYNKIKEFSGKDFGYDVINNKQENNKAIVRMIKWKDAL